jgi:hypothetical protein
MMVRDGYYGVFNATFNNISAMMYNMAFNFIGV